MPKNRSQDGNENDGDDNGPSQPRRRFRLPAWLDHFNAHDLKMVFRCWVAIWVSTLLIFIGPALHSIGIATFFGSLLLYIVPPAGILFVYLLGALSLLFGMCLAWAWGLLTMKAALAARPSSQTQARLQQLQQEAARQAQQTGESSSWVAQKLVHDGFMLDARVTVIFYVMSCVFVYVMARVRVANQKFALAETFGNIVMDLFLLFGPTLTSFTPKLAEVLVEPGAIGMGLGTVCCLLFFPQSTSHAVLGKMEQLVSLGEKSLNVTRTRLAGKHAELTQLQSLRANGVALFKSMQPMMAFLPLDMSRGRWSADDVRSLQDPVRQALVAHLALLDFHIARVKAEKKFRQSPQEEEEEEEEDAEQEKSPRGVGSHQLRESRDMMHALNAPEQGIIRSHVIEALQQSTAELLQSCSETITTTTECIRMVNTRRWLRQPPQEQFDQLVSRGERVTDRLRSVKHTCVTETTEKLIDCHAEHFDENGQLKATESLGPHALRSLILGMVIEERILALATALEHLLDRVLQLLKTRNQTRIWFPTGLRYAITWMANSRLGAPGFGQSIGATANNPDTTEEQAQEDAYRRLRISKGYGASRRQGRLSRFIRGTHDWLTGTAGMYALRMVVVTIATSIPASLPSSAGFFYRERGIWGTITGQVCVLVYMADFTLSLVGRVLGTIVGGLMGMVAWYIGSGYGPGNAYGLAAISAAMILVIVWCRLFLPQPLTGASVISGATFALVVGFSYDDAHTQMYGLPGRGYQAFYKRVVIVLLGVVAALVVQVFPRPPSASLHVQKTLSNAVRTLSDHYALLLSHWNRSDSNPINVVAEQISLDLAESLLSVQGPIRILKYEINLGPFDQQTLHRIQTLCQDMNQALVRLLILSGTLPLDLQERLVRTVGILDDQVIGAVMAVLGVVEQVLQTGSPLPERLSTPLLRRCYEAWHAKHRSAELSTSLVRDENYRRYCVAVSSYLKFLSAIDDTVIVLKSALGESHVVDRFAGQTSV